MEFTSCECYDIISLQYLLLSERFLSTKLFIFQFLTGSNVKSFRKDCLLQSYSSFGFLQVAMLRSSPFPSKQDHNLQLILQVVCILICKRYYSIMLITCVCCLHVNSCLWNMITENPVIPDECRTLIIVFQNDWHTFIDGFNAVENLLLLTDHSTP